MENQLMPSLEITLQVCIKSIRVHTKYSNLNLELNLALNLTTSTRVELKSLLMVVHWALSVLLSKSRNW